MIGEEQYEKIESYLANRMNAVDRQAFEQDLADNEALRQTLAVHKDMQQYYAPSPKDDLRKNLQQIRKGFDAEEKQKATSDKTTTKPWRRWRGLFFLILIAISWWSFSKLRQDTNAINTPTPSTTVAPTEMPAPVITPPDSMAIKENATESSPPGKQATETKPPPVPGPIAANFELNPRLETEIASTLRGDFSLELQSPEKDQIIHPAAGVVMLNLAGTLETTLVPNEDFSLFLEVFANNPADYVNGRYTTRQKLLLETVPSAFFVAQNFQFEATAGLYYFLIKDDFSGSVLTGGRFYVRER